MVTAASTAMSTKSIPLSLASEPASLALICNYNECQQFPGRKQGATQARALHLDASAMYRSCVPWWWRASLLNVPRAQRTMQEKEGRPRRNADAKV